MSEQQTCEECVYDYESHRRINPYAEVWEGQRVAWFMAKRIDELTKRIEAMEFVGDDDHKKDNRVL